MHLSKPTNGELLSKLIIVESPAKARTIKGFLSKEYEVVASKGHIRDLPKSSFGITYEDGVFTPKYSIAKENAKTVKELKTLAKKADEIYLATDEDREGEAISFHIAYAIGKKPEDLPRIVFHEITKSAIQHALDTPKKVDMAQVNAQQARRLLDRMVGYKLSPLVASKIQKGLSAGRVQSSALKIVVDREREIKAFKPVEFWSINAMFEKNVDASLVSYKGDKIDKMSVQNEAQAKEIEATINAESYMVDSITSKDRKTSTPPPFMTSTLQQTASTVLGFSPKKTMMVAQKLYEGVKTSSGTAGVITYMRTDSLNIAEQARYDAKEYILAEYGKAYVPAKPKFYKSKAKGAQEAHEAIRPTMIDFSPMKAAKYLGHDELKLYRLIFNRFMASQMTDALFEIQNILFKSDSTVFKANGRKLKFDGFYKVMGNEDKDKLLPTLTQGAKAELSKLELKQNFTEPPPRYSEASLVKTLEGLGIGRPSTYAPTISLLQNRKYIEIDKKRIIPDEMAFKVIEMLEEHFPNIVDSAFTSKMEEDLDEIAESGKDWQDILRAFYEPFMESIAKGKENIKSQKIAIPTGKMCPECGSEMLLRKGRYGEFVACSGFPKCKHTENVDGTIKEATPKKPVVTLEIPCPKCGGDIVERYSRRGKFYGCGAYPKCKFTSTYEPTAFKCPECEGMMAKKVLKKGDFLVCIDTKCKHQMDYPKS